MPVSGACRRSKPGLLLTGALTIAFLVGQLIAWQQAQCIRAIHDEQSVECVFLSAYRYTRYSYSRRNVCVGTCATMVRAFSGIRRAMPMQLRHSVELCTIYWHFLLLVWLVFFGLMLST